MNKTTHLKFYGKLTTIFLWMGFVFVITPEILWFVGAPDEIKTNIEFEYSTDPISGDTYRRSTETDISDPNPMIPYSVSLIFLGWILWLYCVYRMHKVIVELSNNAYPISPAKAVWSHLIPFYNLFWVFRWTIELKRFANEVLSRNKSKIWAGIFLCFSLLLALISGKAIGTHAIGLLIALIVGLSISSNIQKVILELDKTN